MILMIFQLKYLYRKIFKFYYTEREIIEFEQERNVQACLILFSADTNSMHSFPRLFLNRQLVSV